jgi:class 3 adenylate cyclase/tetratricopeptide (TPR) repeat protein
MHMKCPRCQTENPHGAWFCGECGTSFAARCAACGAVNPSENRYCGQCGAALADGGPPTGLAEPGEAAAALTGEFKRVSMLFCDIVDSTGLTERIGAEALHELLRRFLDGAIAVVNRLAGSVPQFTGDGFMALFGAPVAQEDHAQRALLAALEVRRIAGGEGGDGDGGGLGKLAVRMGINSGLVVFGAVADRLRMDRTAIGDAANIAARLQAEAAPGEIVIGEATLALTRGFARVAPIGTLSLRGVSEPIAAYRLLGASSRNQAADPRSGPRIFTGRHDELALLRQRLLLSESGQGQAVGICGEPGIGKSRLALEFRRSLAGRAITWVDGRCVSYGTGIPYSLLLDMLRSTCRIADGDTPQAIAGKVRAGLRLAGLDAEADSPLLLDLLGIAEARRAPGSGNPESVKTRAFEIFRQLAIRGSRRQPLVLFAEDLHWVDKTTEEFLTLLPESLAGERILLLATYRPGYRPVWSGRAEATEITLGPLSREESDAMLGAVVDRQLLPDAMVETILGKAEGNPFFIEQLALHAGEEPRSRSADEVPSTIGDVVMARIDRLPPATKRLLLMAAVIGRQFSLRLLREVWQGLEPITAQLAELTQLEFLQEQFEPAGPSYAFRHVLTQDTAYGGLLARDRRRTHARVGRALEQLYRDRVEEVTELLALHWGRNDDEERAVDYAIAAAEKAQRRWANAEALSYFDDALTRLAGMPDKPANRVRRIDAVIKQAEVMFALGRHAEHIAALEAIRAITEEAGDPRRRATWHYWMGFLHSLTGSPPAMAIDDCRQAAAIAAQAGFDELDGFIGACLAQAYVVAGEFRAAIEAGERALDVFESQGNHWWAGRTLWHLASAALYLGEFQRSINYCRRAIAYGDQLDDHRLKVVGLYRLGSAFIQQGALADGLRCCEDALVLKPIGYDLAWVKTVRGYGLIKAGDVDAGIADLAEAISWFDNSHLQYVRVVPALRLAEGYLRRGDRAAATQLIDQVVAISETTGYRYVEGLARRLMAECAEADAATAREHLNTARSIFVTIGAQNDLAKVLASQGEMRQRDGDLAAARELFETAAEIFGALGTLDESARMQIAVAKLDSAGGKASGV